MRLPILCLWDSFVVLLSASPTSSLFSLWHLSVVWKTGYRMLCTFLLSAASWASPVLVESRPITSPSRCLGARLPWPYSRLLIVFVYIPPNTSSDLVQLFSSGPWWQQACSSLTPLSHCSRGSLCPKALPPHTYPVESFLSLEPTWSSCSSLRICHSFPFDLLNHSTEPIWFFKLNIKIDVCACWFLWMMPST